MLYHLHHSVSAGCHVAIQTYLIVQICQKQLSTNSIDIFSSDVMARKQVVSIGVIFARRKWIQVVLPMR
ncbi:unnamed protein product [Arabidopsis halleri]